MSDVCRLCGSTDCVEVGLAARVMRMPPKVELSTKTYLVSLCDACMAPVLNRVFSEFSSGSKTNIGDLVAKTMALE